jgi:hypothetical protein
LYCATYFSALINPARNNNYTIIRLINFSKWQDKNVFKPEKQGLRRTLTKDFFNRALVMVVIFSNSAGFAELLPVKTYNNANGLPHDLQTWIIF